ncbi:B3 domain-containing protein Os01g0723500-like [Bidens hawaiensis]|uniref:B3 domain-containing protein Os01g0723500-like n=1 Tax=Bidens hawaiensis TaxID=980011 RepID=UPI00404B6DE1
MRDHFLENGDALVFKYDGNLHFTIQIFDQSSCEKETAFSAECHQHLGIFDQHFAKKRDREYESLFTNTVDFVPKKPRSQPHEVNNIGEMQSGLPGSVNGQCELLDFLNNVDFSSSGLNTPITNAMPISEVSPSDEELGRLSASEADKIARSFTSSFPHFTQVMKRFNISGSYTLNVPYQFAMAYLPNCKVIIVLHNLKGESWTVNSIPTTRVQTSHTFCGGWLVFVRGNNINVSDICIFELVGNCEMRVNIIRVRQEPEESEHGGDLNGPANGATTTFLGRLTKKVKRKPLKTQISALIEGQMVAFSTEKVKLGIAAKGPVDSHLRTSNRISGKSRLLQEKRGSSMTGCTSTKSGPEEKFADESFISSFPYFVTVMKIFNISGSYTLKVPIQFSMEHLPNCRTAITLRNLQGECWTVNSVPTVKVQTLHTFCGGWMAFVRDNGIQIGDICIFELVGRCEMRVHITSVGKTSIGSKGNGDFGELAADESYCSEC